MFLSFLLACVHHQMGETDGAVSFSVLKKGPLQLLPVQKIEDLPAPALPALAPPSEIESQLTLENLPQPTLLDPVKDAAFLRNAYIGNILFGGGLVRSGEVALEVRSRLLQFNQQSEMAVMGEAWLKESLSTALSEKHLSWTPLALPATMPAPVWVPYRGLHPEDGHDNVNIPRTHLKPADWPEAPRGLVMAPYLRAYYTHSGGWFNGQQYGCLGGARVEIFLVLYEDGRPEWWMEGSGRYLGKEGSPSRAQLDQYLLWAEDAVEYELKKQLFR